MRGWKQHERDEKNNRGHLVCKALHGAVNPFSPIFSSDPLTLLINLFILVNCFSSASRELSRIEREQRARRYFEQQLQQRKKKLLEHRLKEERRRAAVEEKRKQRLKEEKVSFVWFTKTVIFSTGDAFTELDWVTLKLVFPELRSVMNQQCVGHRRRAKRPCRAPVRTPEEGSSPRTVSIDELAAFFQSPLF